MDLKMFSTFPAIGGQISCGSSSYQVQSLLGQGTYSDVVKCMRMEDMKTVAIKIMKYADSDNDWVKKEVSILSKLRSLDLDKCNLVRWYQAFDYMGHTCLEFEHLEMSLLDFMKERNFQPLQLKEIRPIVQQLAIALYYLGALKIIHADLKPGNVMLVSHAQEPYRVKLIDFGLALEFSETEVGSYIQTRPYRTPELILGCEFTAAIDMWSLGCLAASLYLGAMLFPGLSEYDMMRYITETLGQLSDLLLGRGCKTNMFFKRVDNSPTSSWKLKTPEQFYCETGILPLETRVFKLTSLKDLLHIRTANHNNLADEVSESSDLLLFVDMLEGMLQLHDQKRHSPRQLLEHPFIKMSHIAEMYRLSTYVQSCYKIMEVCHKTKTSKAGKAACSSVQQPFSRTAQSVQQIPCPPPAQIHGSTAVRRPPAQHTDASGSSQTQSCIRQGLTREMADSDDVGSLQSNSDPCERSNEDIKRSWKSDAGPSPSCSSSWNHDKTCISPKLKRRLTQDADSDNQELSGHKTKRVRKSDESSSTSSSSQGFSDQIPDTDPCQSSQTKSCTGGQKRKMVDSEDVRHLQSNSGHYRKSYEDVKRFHKSDAGWSPSCSSSWNHDRTCISPKLKRSLTQDADSDNQELSGHKTKRVRKSDESSSTSSSSQGFSDQIPDTDPCQSSQTKSCTGGQKRKMVDSEDVRHLQSNSGHYRKSNEDVKRFQKSDAGRSSSCSSRRNQRQVSPKAERRLHKKGSGHERSRDRKSNTGRDTCSTNSSHTPHVEPVRRSSPSKHHHHHRAEHLRSTLTVCHAQYGLERPDDKEKARHKMPLKRRY